MRLTRSQLERFLAGVPVLGEAECWPWLGKRHKEGYGRLALDGRWQYAHRLHLELVYGSLPRDGMVLHRCNNKPCVNPAHLYVGGKRANAVDAVRDGVHPQARKLTCKNGHPYDKVNATSGARLCDRCTKEYWRERRKKNG